MDLTLLRTSAVLAALVLGALTGRVDAQPTGLATPATTRMTLPAGRGFAQAFLEINLSADDDFEPVSLAPDLWYGVTDELTVGVVHSSRGTTGMVGGSGSSLCLRGTLHGCPSVYPSAGLAVRYHLRDGASTLALDSGMFFRSFEPTQLAIKLGLVGRHGRGDLALELAPNLMIGVTEREPRMAARNTEVLTLPVAALYRVAATLDLAAGLGVVLPFYDTGDDYAVTLSIGARALPTARVSVDLALSLPQVLAGDDLTAGTDARSLTLGGSYAF